MSPSITYTYFTFSLSLFLSFPTLLYPPLTLTLFPGNPQFYFHRLFNQHKASPPLHVFLLVNHTLHLQHHSSTRQTSATTSLLLCLSLFDLSSTTTGFCCHFPLLLPSFRCPTRAAWTATRYRWKESGVTLWSSGTPPLSRPLQPSSPYSFTSHGLPSPETRMVSERMSGGSMYDRSKCVCVWW